VQPQDRSDKVTEASHPQLGGFFLSPKDLDRSSEPISEIMPTFGENGHHKSTPLQWFVYDQLGLSQSTIRLVHILPDLSDDGLLQYRITHASTAAYYVCLSYLWNYSPQFDVQAEDRAKANIPLINASLYSVQENIFNFLCMARYNGSRDCGDPRRFDLTVPIWIDALCIDQSSSGERKHLVAQMGRIYSGAAIVHCGSEKLMLTSSNFT
jgi:hypothetical protein